ncbi:Mitochondrial distribution and morphology protein 10, partial [Coemansia erecta]
MFTAPDYFPFLIRQFHHQTRWDEHNSYSTFCQTSREIIDFAIPRGVSVSTGRSISNRLSSQLVFSMIPSKASSIGYLASSQPLFAGSPPFASVSASTLTSASDSLVDPEATDTTTSKYNMLLPLDPVPSIDGSGLVYLDNSINKRPFSTMPEQPLYQTESLSLPAHFPTNSEVIDNPSSSSYKPKHELDPNKKSQYAYNEQEGQNLLDSVRAGVWKCNWDIGNPDAQSENDRKDYLMVAQMYPSLSSITGSYIKRRSPISELTISGVSVAGAHPDIRFILQHAVNKRRWSSETILASSGKLIGLRSQYNFGNVEALDRAAYAYYCGSDEDAKRVLYERAHGRLSIGSEVYYGAQDSSGGISVGARYRYDFPLFSELTCVLNPIMGHL